MNKIVNGVANDYEYEMPFEKKYKDVAKVLYSIRKLQEEQVIQLQEENKNLHQELDQYKNNWEELKKWLKEDKELAENNFEMGRCFNMFDILNKMKELEEKSND